MCSKPDYWFWTGKKWLLEAHDKTKLRTFIEIYDSNDSRAVVESLLPRSHSSLISQLKTGILPLHIEMGHWKDKPLKNGCVSPVINVFWENEYHFLVHCVACETLREQIMETLVQKGVSASCESNSEFMKSILQKDELKTTGKFIGVMCQKRRELLPAK